MGSRIRDNYSFLLALISGGVLGLSASNSFISSVALIGGVISWIWISEVLKKRMYANATPSAPVTSFNQISLVFGPMVIAFMIFVIGAGLGGAVSDGIRDYQDHQNFERIMADRGTPAVPTPVTSCSIAGEWKNMDIADASYTIRQDGTLDFRDSTNKNYFSGRWTSTGGDQYEFMWDWYPTAGKQQVDSVRLASNCNTLSMTNNYGGRATAIRI